MTFIKIPEYFFKDDSRKKVAVLGKILVWVGK